MKWLVAASVLLLLVLAIAVQWLTDEEAADFAPVAAASGASSSLLVQRQSLQQREVASREDHASATISVVDEPETRLASAPQVVDTQSSSGCRQKDETQSNAAFEINAALRNGEGAGLGSSTLDKAACFAAVPEIKRARWMFDATPTQTVAYHPRSDFIWHGLSVQEIVLHELCSGDQPFNATSKATVELFFVTAKETTRILIGPTWVSDGTIQSPLTDEQYARITNTLAGRRRDVIGPGGNMSAELFAKRLQERYFNRITAEENAQKQRDDELRRAQQGLPSDCVE